jgi:hypothetical protein
VKVKQEQILSAIMNHRTLANSLGDHQQSSSGEEALVRRKAEEHEELRSLMKQW